MEKVMASVALGFSFWRGVRNDCHYGFEIFNAEVRNECQKVGSQSITGRRQEPDLHQAFPKMKNPRIWSSSMLT